jgi:hypothetical protein
MIHQNHGLFTIGHGHFAGEAQRNLRLAGGIENLATLRDATWLLRDGQLRRPKALQRTYQYVMSFSSGRDLMCLKRKMKRRVLGWQVQMQSARSAGQQLRPA